MPRLRPRVVVGLGSNLGDRRGNIDVAFERIEAIPFVARPVRSAVRETAPVGPPQPDYLNAALCAECTETPERLLDALLDIERSMGRVRRERWGPRTIDLDILWWEGLTMETASLTIPHARLHERAFAIVPLLEVAPDATDPRTGAGYVAPTTRTT